MTGAVIAAIDVLRNYLKAKEPSADLVADLARAMYNLLVACTQNNPIIVQMMSDLKQEMSNR